MVCDLNLVAKVVLKAGSTLTRIGNKLAKSNLQDNSFEVLLSGKNYPFGVFIDASAKGLYQLKMWLPSFEAIGKDFFIISGRKELVPEIQKLTKRPTFVVNNAQISRLAKVPGLKTWIFVNNSPRNSDLVRFPQFTHIQLMHGDSEKTANFTPVNGMYSKIFVAGQAGVDRYARNGVKIANEKFVKVGRPQVFDVKVGVNPNADPTVLICPTWGGSAEDEIYTSLSLTPIMAKVAIEKGVRVIYRPHPFSLRAAEDLKLIDSVHRLLQADNDLNNRGHLFGKAATEIPESVAINSATAMISDISGIVSDWLFSLKPYLLISMDRTAKEFATRYPVAQSGLVLDELSEESIRSKVGELLAEDKLLKERQNMRNYYFEGADEKDLTKLFVKAVQKTLGN